MIYLNELCNFDNEHNASALIQNLFAKIRFQALFKDYLSVFLYHLNRRHII